MSYQQQFIHRCNRCFFFRTTYATTMHFSKQVFSFLGTDLMTTIFSFNWVPPCWSKEVVPLWKTQQHARNWFLPFAGYIEVPTIYDSNMKISGLSSIRFSVEQCIPLSHTCCDSCRFIPCFFHGCTFWSSLVEKWPVKNTNAMQFSKLFACVHGNNLECCEQLFSYDNN